MAFPDFADISPKPRRRIVARDMDWDECATQFSRLRVPASQFIQYFIINDPDNRDRYAIEMRDWRPLDTDGRDGK